jgi:hypothetical protein
MSQTYDGVTTRFLRPDERLILSNDRDMPFVIEAKEDASLDFLYSFLTANSTKILEDVSRYGAVLFRGFEVTTDCDFETAILSIKGLQGMSQALMSEEGRIPVDGARFVMHTNAVYKTGGTLYLGGFHSENYYSPDVPAYISFCCMHPSKTGGETGLVNMKKIYQQMAEDLKQRLEKQPFFVAKWLVSDVATRYNCSTEDIEQLCREYDLPLVGEGKNTFIFMYKPNVLSHSETKEKALHLNLFEIHRLNAELRRCFMDDYSGKAWYWHRFVWRLPKVIFKSIKFIYVLFVSFMYSPKDAIETAQSKRRVRRATKSIPWTSVVSEKRVGSCFSQTDVKQLAKSIRQEYVSCLWKKGDILLVDNQQVMHAGMPGSGSRVIRAMICNPLNMTYASTASGHLTGSIRVGETLGAQLSSCSQSKEDLCLICD